MTMTKVTVLFEVSFPHMFLGMEANTEVLRDYS